MLHRSGYNVLKPNAARAVWGIGCRADRICPVCVSQLLHLPYRAAVPSNRGMNGHPICYHERMDRFLDKAVVLACCLVAAGCVLVEAGASQAAPAQAGEAALPFAVSMLAALACSAAAEAVSLPVGLAGFTAYCIAACFAPAAEVFVPLAVYDFVRCIHRSNALRFTGASAICAFAACVLGQTLPPLAVGALLCAALAAAALSVRTSTALARQHISHSMRDELASQTLSLRKENRSLAKDLDQLKQREHESSPGSADAPATCIRPAAFACLSEREYEVARLVAEGLDNREIAAAAYLSEGTVRNNISSILSKMALKNRTQIAVTYWKSLR